MVSRKIRDILSYFFTSVVHIFRETNSSADKLASLYFQSDRVFEDVSSLPSDVKNAMVLDAKSVPFVRTIVDKG